MKRSSMNVMMRLLELVKPLTGTMILAVTMGVAGHLCAIGIPVLGAMALTGTSLKTVVFVLPVIAIARGVFHLLEQNRNHYLAFTLLALLRDKVFGALRKLAPAKLEGRDKGNLIAILTADIELLEVFYAHTISPICIALIVSVIMTVCIGSFHPVLGGIACVAYVVVGVIVPFIASKRSKAYGESFRREFGELDAFVLDSLRGVKESIQYGAGEQRLQQIYDYADSLSEKEKKLKGEGGTSAALTGGILLLFDVLMVFASSKLLQAGSVDGRSAVISVITLMSSFGPVIALANLGTGLQNTIAAGNRVLDVLDAVPVVQEVKDGKDIQYTGAEVEHIQFAYEQEEILNDFSMSVPKQGIIGITGKSGSGKSTLLKLLMRFWDTDQGTVEISGENIRDINTSSLRANQSFVTQDTVLFHESIRKNLLIANPEATEEQMIEACKKASVQEFIESLPKGYDTNIGELGETLSGGERQRLGIARAFLHDAPLVLLDEPTSNLDSLNEAVILKSLKDCCEDKAVLLVSHRKSTMCIADTVYSVENGRMC
ncbi:MAG: thiol reductant ABC exporter subunit CydC [Bulleidia sp.]|nr:thiol reductant ABC exporter subunit CydC [Bulleidia sp.]